MVCIYGMDEHFGLATVDPQTDSSEIRKAVNRILTEEMKKAVQEITENRPKLDALVAKLMKSNRLTETEIEQILSEPLRAEQ